MQKDDLAMNESIELPNAQATSDLDGSRWVLAFYLDASGQTAAANPAFEPTAEFRTGRVAGVAGCNTYRASCQARDGKLTVGRAASTMMACEPSVMAQERAFLNNLQAAVSYRRDGDLLAISDAQGVVMLTFRAERPPVLTDATWLMTSYNNGKGGFQSVLADVQVTAVFGDDGKLTGHSGCNRYSATYTIAADKIEIGPPRTTRMMCPEPIMDQETAYLKALAGATVFRMERSRLVMRDAGGAAMVAFVRAQRTPV